MKKNESNEIFKEYFTYENPSILAQDLHNANHTKNGQTINQVNDRLIGLKNDVYKQALPENENSDKIMDIVKRYLNLRDMKVMHLITY